MVRDLFQLNTLYKRIIVGLSVLVVILVATCGVLGVQTYARVVERGVLEQNMTDAAASVSTLEREYMHRLDLLTLEDAHSRGFVNAEVSLFVSRDAHTLTLHDRAH